MTKEPIPPYARGYETFEGRIGRTIAESRRAWPAEKPAPEGAPNIVVILLDDMGYSDIGPFGSEIETPHLDHLAQTGVTLTNYHTTPVCSPARAALLTGLNPHRAGFASVANPDPGFPGLRLELDEDVVSLPEILQGHGYATFGALNEYGRLHVINGGTLATGHQKIQVSAIAGEDFRVTYLLSVNGVQRAALEDVWAFVGMAPFSGIDVGVNRGGPVHWDLYERHGSFRYTGTLHYIHYEPGSRAPYDPLVLAELELEVALTYD